MQRIKKGLIVFLSICSLMLCCILTVPSAGAAAAEVYVGGMPAGFTLGLGGAQVIGICEILTRDGTECPARDASLQSGDVIVEFGGMAIRSAEDIGTALTHYRGGSSSVTVKSAKKADQTGKRCRDGEI